MGKGKDLRPRKRRKKTQEEKIAENNEKNKAASRGASALTMFFHSAELQHRLMKRLNTKLKKQRHSHPLTRTPEKILTMLYLSSLNKFGQIMVFMEHRLKLGPI